GQAIEPLEVKTLEFEEISDREWGALSKGEDWAVKGRANHADGKCRIISDSLGLFQFVGYPEVTYLDLLKVLDEKFRAMESEVRYESYEVEDADLILVGWEYGFRVSREAMAMARGQGLKVGVIRPVTLWPFPYEIIKTQAKRGAKFLVVEDSLGQMIEDVKMAVSDETEVHLVGSLERHLPYENGMIFPSTVMKKIEGIMKGATK
ncbi:MAG: transketolase C-terminal domain-containing protein, partial [Chloroflexota bacterium]|nr:transketolase C-terminal domain-containing protein [Chloroflexota bacterium]